jgi:hypothetical protein
MGVPCLGLGLGDIGRVIPSQECINGSPHAFRQGEPLLLSPLVQTLNVFFREV